jgi:hypothetical protein
MFHAAMRKDGLLAMEHTQRMPEELLPLFKQVASNAQVYSKIETPAAAQQKTDPGATWRVDPPKGSPELHCGPKVRVLRGD